jgi:hypothetical protein
VTRDTNATANIGTPAEKARPTGEQDTFTAGRATWGVGLVQGMVCQTPKRVFRLAPLPTTASQQMFSVNVIINSEFSHHDALR